MSQLFIVVEYLLRFCLKPIYITAAPSSDPEQAEAADGEANAANVIYVLLYG